MFPGVQLRELLGILVDVCALVLDPKILVDLICIHITIEIECTQGYYKSLFGKNSLSPGLECRTMGFIGKMMLLL